MIEIECDRATNRYEPESPFVLGVGQHWECDRTGGTEMAGEIQQSMCRGAMRPLLPVAVGDRRDKERQAGAGERPYMSWLVC
jgi:hypothetical protein